MPLNQFKPENDPYHEQEVNNDTVGALLAWR